MGSKRRATVVLLLYLSLFLVASSASYKDTLQQGESLRYDMQLESSNKMYRLGFCLSDDARDESVLAIWFKDMFSYEGKLPDDPWSVWVGNRKDPVSQGFGVLSLEGNGDLSIKSGEEGQVVTNLYKVGANSINTSATLQDNGNFVLHELDSDGSVKRILWQSFDHPTDTLLPGMKLGINKNLTSWMNYRSPRPGLFTFGMNPNGAKELVIWRQEDVMWRSGILQPSSFRIQYSSLIGNLDYNFSFIQNGDETFFMYTVNSTSSFTWIGIDPDGQLKRFHLGVLDMFGMPIYETLVSCSQQLKASFFLTTQGQCTTKQTPQHCNIAFGDEDPSCKIGVMSKPGTIFSDGKNLTLQRCRTSCLSNCYCLAYALTNHQDIVGCEIWTTRVKFHADNSSNGRCIYIRPFKGNNWWLTLTIAVGGMMVVPSLLSFCYVLWKKCTSNGDEDIINQMTLIKELEGNDAPSTSFGKRRKDRNELHVFSFENILSATDYFSDAKKLGEGGYGPVYKGIVNDGREVAMKRLSGSSGQGVAEFKNEVLLIAKLQHTNLVRLLGFCIQGEEKILIYEYLPNNSLDSFLFDPEKKKKLSWSIRFHIVEGIAQGLLYLHKYSRLRVIHRDLKASNILLDKDMNPKISDFGMARIFELNEFEANTNRVVGTHGYMSPEYVFHGLVSVKTDVFGFGVLLLELVAGRKNTTSYDPESPLLLTGHAWQLWNEGRGLELIDPSMDECRPPEQISRCIHIGLLCVQDHAVERPTMSDVVSMLANENTPLPEPKQPGFSVVGNRVQKGVGGVSEINPQTCSINLVTVTVMEAR